MTMGMMIQIPSLTNVCRSLFIFIVCFDHIASALVVKKVAPLITSKKVNEPTLPLLGLAHHNIVF
jgi:hypothetical protein